jgi:hypothetical protein
MSLRTTVGILLAMVFIAGCGGKQKDTTTASSTENKAAEVVQPIASETQSETLDAVQQVKTDTTEAAATMEPMLDEKADSFKGTVSDMTDAMKETVTDVAGKLQEVKTETEKSITAIIPGEAVSMSQSAAAVGGNEFSVYSDKNSRTNHFAPSGWMGDYGDIKLDEQAATNPHSGATSLQFTYSAKKSQNAGWAGIFWQNPPNNWGTKKGGFNLTGMTKLVFWARGEKGGEIIQKFMVGGIKGAYPDSTVVEMGPVELTKEWKEYTLNLAGKDLSSLSGGFGWATTEELNPQGAVFYIDDIKYVADPSVKPEGKKVQTMPFFVYADRGFVGNHFIPSGWMGDYGDLKIDQGVTDNPHSGKTSMKVTYTNNASQGARWAGIFWQQPANNWGTAAGAGFDLSKAKKLTFWARGEKGGEQIAEFKVGGIMGEYPDSDSAVIGPIVLNKDWTEYSIDLAGKDMSFVIGGFCWASNIDLNPNGIVFFLDDIRFE